MYTIIFKSREKITNKFKPKCLQSFLTLSCKLKITVMMLMWKFGKEYFKVEKKACTVKKIN